MIKAATRQRRSFPTPSCGTNQGTHGRASRWHRHHASHNPPQDGASSTTRPTAVADTHVTQLDPDAGERPARRWPDEV